jgi:hypothetical protein
MGIGFYKGKRSESGWEDSWFGGYNRMVSDHPMITLDFKVDVRVSASLSRELGWYNGEKVIKMYLLQVKKLGLIESLDYRIEEVEHPFMGKKTYEIISLESSSVMRRVIGSSGDLAPLFEKYEKEIRDSFLQMALNDKKNKKGEGDYNEGEGDYNEGEGDPNEGEGDPNEGEGDPNEGEGDPNEGEESPDKKKSRLVRATKNIKQGKKWSSWKDWKPLSEFSATPEFVHITEHRSPYIFTAQEVKNSEMLLKLLDISFEPKSDVVKSLRIGKLDASKIAEVPAGNISVYQQVLEEQDTRPFTFCVLADLSGSMGSGYDLSGRAGAQFSVMNSLYLALSQILPPDKLFIYGHTGDDNPDIYTFYSPYETSYDKRIPEYRKINFQQNYDGPVIEAIHKKIRETNDDRIIFLVLSDGSPCGNNYGSTNDFNDLKRILEKCRRDEFVTVGVGIQADHVKHLYTYSKVVSNLTMMPKEVASIINQVVRTEFK